MGRTLGWSPWVNGQLLVALHHGWAKRAGQVGETPHNCITAAIDGRVSATVTYQHGKCVQTLH